MHLMMTMTYDGLTSWKQYELTLPMSKYQIIFSKYLTSLLLVPISIMGTVIIYIIRYVVYHNFTLSQFGFSIAIAIALPVLWCSICLAIAQWFGYMRVQYVRMICTLLVIFFRKQNIKRYEIRYSKFGKKSYVDCYFCFGYSSCIVFC
ncbi:MAG: ABC-2 transporter permease [Ruminococcus sp.]